MQIKKLILVLVLSLGLANAAFGEFFHVRVGDGTNYTFAAGTNNIKIPVYAYDSNTATPLNITGYSLAFDLGGSLGVNSPTLNGIGFSSAFTNITGDFSDNQSLFFVGGNGQFFTDPLDIEAGATPGYDFVAVNSGPSFTLTGSGNPKKLFDIIFDVSSSAVAGTYGLSFVPTAVDQGNGQTNSISLASGTFVDSFAVGTGANFNQFTITAVPEPSTMVLVGLVAAGGGALRFVRRRRAVI